MSSHALPLIARMMEAFNISFVGAVEKHPELYDCRRPDYSRKPATERAWHEVSREVKLPANECKEKWRNLRTSFARNLRPPSGSKKKTKKPYYLHDAMQFILPFTKAPCSSTTTSENLSPAPSENSEVTELECFVVENNPSLPELVLPTNTSDLPTTSASSSVEGHSESQQSSSFQQVPSAAPAAKRVARKRKKSVSVSDAEEASVAEESLLETKKSKIDVPSSKFRQESTQQFLNSLIPDLLSMSDVQLRAFKRGSLLLIDQILGNTPLELTAKSMFSRNLGSTVDRQSTADTHVAKFTDDHFYS